MLHATTRKDLLRRIGAPAGGKLAVTTTKISGMQLVQAVHEREVPLGSLHNKLAGVVAKAPETAIIGSMGNKTPVMGALPEPVTTQDEVLSFVQSLIHHDRIAWDAKRDPANEPGPHTHTIKKVGGKKVLTRLRFLCRPR